MIDYEPLDLGSLCNAGDALLKASRRPPAGDLIRRGLPFRIPEAEQRFLAFGGSHATATTDIAIGRPAHTVLIGHVMLESRLHEGAPPGGTVARYVFELADGQRFEVPIRERFEIGVVPTDWGESAFLAAPDIDDSLFERSSGQWGAAGARQCEVRQGWPHTFYLWCWRSPAPGTAVARMTIESPASNGGFPMPFLIAAVTLGHVDEDPLVRPAAVPVKLTLPRAEDAAEPFSLAVEVDRGIAAYPYALPAAAADEFLACPSRGFGEPQNPGNSPAYTEVTAIPSATLRVKRGDEEIAATTWGELERAGSADTDRVRFEIVDTGRNWVHTTVLDDATGKPVPCRVHFRSPDGIPWAPHGHHPHVNSNMGTWHIDVGGDLRMGQITYAYIDGKCQGWLPRGEVVVDVARGYEYEPLRTTVEIKPGQRELRLRLKRHTDLNAQRYFSGDTHVHFLSTQGAVTEAAAEDLDVVNLLLSQWGHLYTNTEEFIGRPVRSGDGETIVYASQENRQHLLGHLTLLGLKEPVMPWCSDGPGEAELGGNLETTLSHWADACHVQGGTVVIPHLPNPNGEPAALIATGRADAVEMLIHNPYFHLEYYRYLNGGYRLPLAGGTDKMDSAVPVGLYRTYAYIPPDEEFTYDAWCKALRGGNTFLSGGPLLRFTVDGAPMGATVPLGRTGGTVEVETVATSIFPIHTLQIVQGGEVVAQTEEAGGAREMRLSTRLKVDRSTWLCARCGGPGYTSVKHHDSWQRGIMAHTSPVYIACGEYDVFSADTAHYMLTLLDGSLQYIRKRAPQWQAGQVTHHHGEHDHLAFLERPFHEAVAAVHRHMHAHGIPH